MAQPDLVLPILPGAAPPERLGRFVLGRELGRGATGVVYAATDARDGRAVALKVLTLPSDLTPARSGDLAERFAREARATSQLSHPAIVALTEFGRAEDGRRYLVMERLEGETLRARLQREGPLLTSEALPLLTQIADALQYAHGRGIVHRDVKPDNIFLCAGGAAKLMDFGVARVYAESALTRAGTVVGSPAYMAPEQISGAALDGRADVFSLAVTLAEALTGRRPFEGADVPTVMYQILHRPPQLDGVGSRPLRRALERALAKSPAARTASAGALASALRQAAPPFAFSRREDRAATLATQALPLWAVTPSDRGGGVVWAAAASVMLAVLCFLVLPVALRHHAPPASVASGAAPRLATPAPRAGVRTDPGALTGQDVGELSITERAVAPPRPQPARPVRAVLQALRDETGLPDAVPPPLPEAARLPQTRQTFAAAMQPAAPPRVAPPRAAPGAASGGAAPPETIPADGVLYGMDSADRLQAPHLISHTDPVSPPGAHGAGAARLLVSVNPAGGVSDARVVQSSGDAGLDDAAIATVLHWQYAPATHDGRPVSANVAETVTFGPAER